MSTILKNIISMLFAFLFWPYLTQAQIFSADYADNTVTVFSDQGVNIKKIKVSSGPREFLFINNKKLLLVSCNDSNCIDIIDTQDLKKINSIKVKSSPRSMIYNPSLEEVYVVCKDDNLIGIFDLALPQTIHYIATNKGPRDLAISVELGILAVSCNEEDCIDLFELPSKRKISTIKTPANPYSIIFLRNDILIGTSIGENKLFGIDIYKKVLIFECKIGKHPTSIKETNIDSTILVTNFDENKLQLFDVNQKRVIDTIYTGKEPFQITFDNATNMIFVTNHGDNTINIYNSKFIREKIIKTGRNPHGIVVLNSK